MRVVLATVVGAVALSASAFAQTPAASATSSTQKGYAEVVAQSAFGNVTSQSFGGEIGFNLQPELQIFVDAGMVRDAAPASLGTDAQRIAVGIANVAGNADFHVKAPVTFGVVGVKYLVQTGNKYTPYVMAGGGFAQVKRDVTFTTSGGDLTQFVTVGSDLSGDETKGMISAGVGVQVPFGSALVVDVNYRYGRVFTSDGLNINRAGIGVGVRF